ncbi:MAG: hypothetical protein C4576_31905 [Desulfobacteraceae bacterium]|jgi:hypothetical protein|nr:MAG: hypothetical protein C4576_31905 [Desulfobacteraceae bacterium]
MDGNVDIGTRFHYTSTSESRLFSVILAETLREEVNLHMKRTEVQLPDEFYRQVEGLAGRLHLTVSELLCKATEQMVNSLAKRPVKPNGDWSFPEGRHLGAFRAPIEDWRLLANESAE